MDGGSVLNILYIDTLDGMRIPRLGLHPVRSPFHGVILGTQAYPLGKIDLPVTFGDRANFHSEVLTFEVEDFLGSYHAILGRPCYVKFMVIPNNTYLKLKMLGPNSVITLGTAVINSAELLELRNSATSVVLDYNELTSSSAFHPTKETKAVGIDPTNPTKTV
ncbi:uncharacterized protein [Miscanthus floridulus]|uniref:uncharacterized protein n=1 Tax=Miscanthus floridulus TaxID=154761 RepID=UPI003457F943